VLLIGHDASHLVYDVEMASLTGKFRASIMVARKLLAEETLHAWSDEEIAFLFFMSSGVPDCYRLKKWQQRAFVSAQRLGTCFMTRIQEVHRLRRCIPIQRGFVFMHTVFIKGSDIPCTTDKKLLAVTNRNELTRRTRLDEGGS
jgi:hypothetical protein